MLNVLRSLRLPHLPVNLNETPEKAFARSNLTQAWMDRKVRHTSLSLILGSCECVRRVLAPSRRAQISNFEYLMALNTYAGRTYNDLTQVRHPLLFFYAFRGFSLARIFFSP